MGKCVYGGGREEVSRIISRRGAEAQRTQRERGRRREEGGGRKEEVMKANCDRFVCD